MNILITGGAGFIGSHITDAYIEEGHRVVVLDNLSTGKKSNLNPKAVFYEMDILDPRVEEIFKKENPQVINHHAAQVSVTQSVRNPAFDAQVNILGSLKLIQLAIDHGVDRFIFASTGGALYGDQEIYPAPEEHPTHPISPYGIAKLTVERYLDFFQKIYAIKPVILRYSNVYGPRQDPHGEAGVVAIFCEKLLNDQVPVIYGDGQQTRDFVSVDDVVQANRLALSNVRSGTFNIGTATETTINFLAQCLLKISGKNLSIHHDSPRPGEARRSAIDFRKFKEACGWNPRTKIQAGLLQTFEYFAKEN